VPDALPDAVNDAQTTNSGAKKRFRQLPSVSREFHREQGGDPACVREHRKNGISIYHLAEKSARCVRIQKNDLFLSQRFPKPARRR
jgi:hypothetical protein